MCDGSTDVIERSPDFLDTQPLLEGLEDETRDGHVCSFGFVGELGIHVLGDLHCKGVLPWVGLGWDGHCSFFFGVQSVWLCHTWIREVKVVCRCSRCTKGEVVP